MTRNGRMRSRPSEIGSPRCWAPSRAGSITTARLQFPVLPRSRLSTSRSRCSGFSRIETYAAGLAQLGFVHVPHADDAVCPFFHKPRAWPHTHHVHVVQSGGDEERRTLAFRDYLREHPEVARAYEGLKRGLAPRYSTTDFSSRQAYADAKAVFVTEVTGRALAAGYPHEDGTA